MIAMFLEIDGVERKRLFDDLIQQMEDSEYISLESAIRDSKEKEQRRANRKNYEEQRSGEIRDYVDGLTVEELKEQLAKALRELEESKRLVDYLL